MIASGFDLGEYAALWDGHGFFELANWSSIAVTGADRQTFLNNFCTNGIKRLTPGTSCEAFFTNVKGKIVAHGLVTCREEELVFIGASGQAAPLIAHLDRYIIREDVQLRDTTLERAHVLVAKDSGQIKWADISARWIPWSVLGGSPGGLLEVAATDVPGARSALEQLGAIPCGEAAFQARRIEAGFPLFGVDFDEHNLPQEIGRNDQAISFTKGCYLGQETVARIDALGHVNQQLVGVRFAGVAVPAAGTELSQAGVVVGRVTSATNSPQLNAPLALAMLRRQASTIGTQLDSPLGPGEVVALPVTPQPEAS